MTVPPARRALLPATLAAVGLLASVSTVRPVAAQEARERTVVTVAGEQYRAGPFHRWILGRHYRDLWTTPIQVELLDLSSFAGGLEPLRRGGGQQTRSLRFLGADGREYSFRSVDKDPSPVLDPLLHGTVVDDLVQDGISAAHPLGALVAAPLLEAVGVLHVEPLLRVMPDDPRLGEFREEFAGMLGLIEERPDENEGERTAFEGAALVISSETLTERLEDGTGDRVDARAFLRARITDLFLGDWDRHRGQWRWATFDEGEDRWWLPVPTDRDQAFSKFDGVAPRIVSLYMPQFVRFEAEYPSIDRLHWNGRALDRWFLAGLERETWDSVGYHVQAALTDEVIEAAVGQLPSEIHALNGEELTRTLRARRDALPEAWTALYELMATEVDLFATDAPELVVVDRSQPGFVSVSILDESRPTAEAYVERRFDARETSEVRIYLRGGDDRVVVRGNRAADLLVRVIGGGGDDSYEVTGAGGGLRLYDERGRITTSGAGVPEVDTEPFDEWRWSEEDRNQPRDWGSRRLPVFWSKFSSDLGIFIGGGVRLEQYGFRRRPYESALTVRGGYAPSRNKGRIEIDAEVKPENSSLWGTVQLRLSALDILSYYGLGNDAASMGKDLHRVDLRSASAGLGFGVELGEHARLHLGATLSQSTLWANEGRFVGTLRDTLYGAEDFSRFGVNARLVVDPVVDPARSGSRFRIEITGQTVPSALDVDSAYHRAGAVVSAILSPSATSPVQLAVRGGGEKVWGRFPWDEAAFIGGSATLRGWDEDRFAGDASIHGSAEVRVRVWQPRVVVPVETGLFAFGDVGRVYVSGASPGGWHGSLGGGLWFKPVAQEYMLRAGMGFSDETNKLYVAIGLPY